MKLLFTCCALILLFCGPVGSQSNAQNTASAKNTNWLAKSEPSKAFIENKGQFDGRNWHTEKDILFAVDNGPSQIFFTKKGLTYRFDKKEKNAERKEGDKSKPKILFSSDLVEVIWENANPYVQLVVEEKTSGYFSYAYYKNGETKNVNYVYGFKKLVYKNLYSNIDVEYIVHPEGGIKYSLILHPGADISKVKMVYSDTKKVSLDKQGVIHIPTMYGDIIDHAPVSFYSGNTSKKIISSFTLTGEKVSFSLGTFDNSKTVIIDPWTVTPTITNSNCVWECDKDAAGNVYIIGGDVPLQLQKYSPSGAWVWTYSTPWDTTNGDWLGALATDLAGNSYVSNGSLAEMHKVNTSGSMVWNTTAPLLSSDEYWAITFNCDQTKLIVGGTRGATFPSMDYKGTIYDINTNNGSVTGYIDVTKVMRSVTVLGFPTTFPNEVRAITSSRNARYYYLTHDSVGAINQNLSLCSSEIIFGINSTYEFGYKCEDWRPLITDNDGNKAGNGGICAIKANGNFVYTQNGAMVHKRSLNTGAIITSAAIPGGVSNASSGSTPIMNIPGNSGLDIDSCGNVYVGSSNAVVKYDANLNLITSVATPYKVYDVTISFNGDVIVAGSTGTSNTTSRTGYVQSINMSACVPFVLECCDASLCSAGPVCVSAAPFTLTPGTSGGTFSGPGITNTSTGMFDPSVAGPGTHTIVYSQTCGSDSITITVNSCLALTACQENNGDVTATSGNAPYSWKVWTPATSTPITNQAECTACGYTWNAFVSQCFVVFPTPADSCVTPAGWTQFSTLTTVTPPGFPILLIDNDGDSLQITSLSSLPLCNPCTPPTATTSSVATTCGQNNGTASVTASSGTTPYTYLWSNSMTTQSISGLAPGTFSVTVTGGGCNVTASVTVTSSTGITATTSSTPASCTSNTGTATVTASGGGTSYTYLWNNSQTSATATGLGAGSFSVTVTSNTGCTTIATATVSSSSGMTGTASANSTSCGNNNGTATAIPSGGTAPYSYLWSNSQTTLTITGLASGTYSVTITDTNGCTVTASSTVNPSSAVSATSSATNTSCGSNNGTATASGSGGTSPYTYLWSNSQTTAVISGLSAGNYAVTITDTNGCTDTSSATVSSSSGLSATTTSTIANCGNSNGTATVFPSGGSSPYSYLWSNGQTTATASGLATGSFQVTVTDNTSCTFETSAIVGTSGGPTATASATPATCNGTATGTATATATGGATPYTYLWSNGQISPTATGLIAGNYPVTITDSNSCQTTSSALVSEPTAITDTTTSTIAGCGSSDGSATVMASGGNPPYSYLWAANAGNQTTATASSLAAGSYSVTITDATGCTHTTAAIVSNANAPDADTVSTTQPSCYGGNDGTAIATATGGASPYIYEWSNGDTTAIANSLSAGTYTVIVTDMDSCSDVLTIAITNPPAVVVQITLLNTSPVCEGDTANLSVTSGTNYLWSTGDNVQNISVNNITSDTSIMVTVTIGGCNGYDTLDITADNVAIGISGQNVLCLGNSTILYASGGNTYLWSTGDTTNSISVSPVSNTTYFVSGSNATGCSDADTITIAVSPGVDAVVSGDTIIGFGTTVQIIASGGGTYQWSNGETGSEIIVSPEQSTSYFVTVTDNYGCSDVDTINITVECRHDISVPSIFSPNSDGLNDVIRVHGYGISKMKFVIYDRWGEKIFEFSGSPKESGMPVWDGNRKGRPLNSAVFVYILEVTFCDGLEETKNGNITLVK